MVRGDTLRGILRATVGHGSYEGSNAGKDEENNSCYDVGTQPITCLSAWSWPFRCVIIYFGF